MTNDALVLSEIDAFYGDSHVLHGVSFRLGEGRLLGLLGRNGAGKSTSMNVTVGLLPPRHGAVTVYGTAVTGRAPEAIGRFAVAIGASAEAKTAADRVSELAWKSGATRLTEIGFDPEKLPLVMEALAARPDIAANTPQPPNEDDLRRLIEEAL